MREEIRRLQARLGITTVYVTHDQEEAMAIADEIAVMDRGRLIQLGSAEDLYARPAVRFVAGFIGRVSMLRARVVGAAHGGVLVDVNGQRLVAEGAARPGDDGTVAIAVRPETIELAPAASDHDSAVVVSRVFLGEKVDYVVEWAGTRLLVCAWDPLRRGTVRVGDRVDVRLPERGVRLLSEDAGT